MACGQTRPSNDQHAAGISRTTSAQGHSGPQLCHSLLLPSPCKPFSAPKPWILPVAGSGLAHRVPVRRIACLGRTLDGRPDEACNGTSCACKHRGSRPGRRSCPLRSDAGNPSISLRAAQGENPGGKLFDWTIEMMSIAGTASVDEHRRPLRVAQQPTRGRIEVFDPVRFLGKGYENGEEGSQEERHEEESRKEEEVMPLTRLSTPRGR